MELKHAKDRDGFSVVTDGTDYVGFPDLQDIEQIYSGWHRYKRWTEDDVYYLGIDKITDWQPLVKP